ncbi:hypothetical protein ACVWZP_003803 [Pseudomonas sp. TE36184]
MSGFRRCAFVREAINDPLNQGRSEFTNCQFAQRLAQLGGNFQENIAGVAIVVMSFGTELLVSIAVVEAQRHGGGNRGQTTIIENML